MSQKEKLIASIRARPSQARYRDVEAVMELYGWRRHRESGSHCVFVKAGHMPFVVPKVGGRMVKGVYLDKICDLLGLDE